MKLREWINRNSALVTALSVFLLVYALIYLLANAPKVVKPVTKAYFYDIQTGQLFEGGVQEIPPIVTPEGSTKNGLPAGVRANVFSCTDCGDMASRYIGYLEMFTPEAQEAQMQLQELELRGYQEDQGARDGLAAQNERQAQEARVAESQPAATQQGSSEMREAYLMEIIARGRLIASTDDLENWFTMESEEGAQLANKAMRRCPGDIYPMQCFPEE